MEHPFKAPYVYDSLGSLVWDANGVRVLDVRAWGHLAGRSAMNLPANEAAELQDQFGREVCEALNGDAKQALIDLLPFVLEGYFPNCATPPYRAAVEKAVQLTGYKDDGKRVDEAGDCQVEPVTGIEATAVVKWTCTDCVYAGGCVLSIAGEGCPPVLCPWNEGQRCDWQRLETIKKTSPDTGGGGDVKDSTKEEGDCQIDSRAAGQAEKKKESQGWLEGGTCPECYGPSTVGLYEDPKTTRTVYSVGCHDCLISYCSEVDLRSAIEGWNNRAKMAQQESDKS